MTGGNLNRKQLPTSPDNVYFNGAFPNKKDN